MTPIVGGLLGFVLIVVYVTGIVLTLSVLFRLVILLPVLTKLARAACAQLETTKEIPTHRRLLDLEDLLRLGRITSEEYDAKRQEILKDL
jgi:uncharacterized membrane protein